MGGPVYRYDADLDSDRKWPAYYDGKAIFGEWNQTRCTRSRSPTDGSPLVDINQLLPGTDLACARWTSSSGRTARST